MLKVNFYPLVEDERLEFAVIVSKHGGRWVLCKHKERDTYECPGGHREPNEPIDETAKRELWEETGATQYELTPICVYSVEKDGEETFGMLYFAQIFAFGPLPLLEMERIELFEALPTHWTYPMIQPLLVAHVENTRR